MNLPVKLKYWATLLWWRLTRPVTVGVRVLLVQDRQILLVKPAYGSSLWFLVGGRVERYENLTDATRREAREEVGAELGELKFLGIFTNYFQHKSDHVAVFACHEFTWSDRSGGEIKECRLFPLDDLPENVAAGHRRRIEEYMRDPAMLPQAGMW